MSSIFRKLKTFFNHKNILPFLGLGISVQFLDTVAL